MLKIGDFSKLSRISIRMLRHYDEIGLLIPETVDHFTGYRYYKEEQLPLAEKIQSFKSMGFSLSVIGEIIDKYPDIKDMEQFLVIRKKELQEEAKIIQERLTLLDSTIKSLKKKDNCMSYIVTLKILPERHVASLRQAIPAYEAEGILWKMLNDEVASQNVQQGTPSYGLAIYHDEYFKENNIDVEIQVSVLGEYKDTEHVRFKKVDSIQIASATFKGSYEQITKANEAVANWIKANGYEFNGSSFCIYHVNPHDAKEPDDLVTEVSYPVKKK